MMNLLEILAVGSLVESLVVEPLVGPFVARIYDVPLVVEPLVGPISRDIRLYYVPLLVERLYDVPLLVEPLDVPCNDAPRLVERLYDVPLLVELLKYESHLHPLVVEAFVVRGLSHIQ